MVEGRPLVARRLRPGHWVAVDAFAATALAAGFSVSAVLGPESVRAVPVIVLACLPLAGRRRWPVAVCALVLVAAVVAAFAGWEEAFVPLAVALHAVALLEARRTAVAALVAALAVTASGAAIVSPSWTEAVSAGGFAWLALALAWTIGLAVREQRAYAAQAVARSAQAAATAERLRMARDVHDVVAHSMGLISMRAGIANHVAATHPEEAGEALSIIGDQPQGAGGPAQPPRSAPRRPRGRSAVRGGLLACAIVGSSRRSGRFAVRGGPERSPLPGGSGRFAIHRGVAA
ncbi:histidine kinase dimerization/phosphoacceptor domain-containing protein [Nonomuraea longicatena]|uniref:histidine kinase n=1 Tax=Nonomuraea longicatena TaxID=83682 RepID=A0ABP4BAK3_9ACTN